ncbi:MAG: hypothetical protein RL387_2006 [Bacteroidota bacterium]|jgi:hypothetical protein
MKYNYYHYKSETFSCPKCNWTGKGSETFLSDLSEIHTLRDIECPKCEHTLYTFDLAKVTEEQKELGNPGPYEKVCFNCTNMMWMVGLGLGVKCRLTMENIPSRMYTCDKFENRV